MIIIEKEDGHHMVLYTIGEVAKILNLRDMDKKPIGRNRMYRVLRNAGVLSKKDNTPMQYYINMGLAVLHTTTKRWKKYTVPCFTERGLSYLEERFKNGKYAINTEKQPLVKNVVNIDDIM